MGSSRFSPVSQLGAVSVSSEPCSRAWPVALLGAGCWGTAGPIVRERLVKLGRGKHQGQHIALGSVQLGCGSSCVEHHGCWILGSKPLEVFTGKIVIRVCNAPDVLLSGSFPLALLVGNTGLAWLPAAALGLSWRPYGCTGQYWGQGFTGAPLQSYLVYSCRALTCKYSSPLRPAPHCTHEGQACPSSFKKNYLNINS